MTDDLHKRAEAIVARCQGPFGTPASVTPFLAAMAPHWLAVYKLAWELMQRDVHGIGRSPGDICDDLVGALCKGEDALAKELK